MRLSRDTTTPLPAWDSERVFFSGRAWFDGLLQDVYRAQIAICLQTYIFDLDDVGQPLLQALTDAARRGVTVRVIVDGIGSSTALGALEKQLSAAGAELHIHHPLPWHWAAARLERGDWFSRFIARLGKLNNRQHSKVCLIDNRIAWTGSFNITAKHIEHAHDDALASDTDWKDCGARVSGERCELFREFFDGLWFQDIERLSSRFLLHPITNFTPVLRKTRLRLQLTAFRRARQRIWVSSAYFSPVAPLVRAFKQAAHRGIDVRIMVPARSDVAFFPALASTYYADLLRAGVHIHEYERGILHTKHLLVDDEVLVGSSNMNHRSSLHDIEIDIPLFAPASLQALDSDFRQSLQHCREITLDNLGRFYAGLLAFGQIPRLLRYWL